MRRTRRFTGSWRGRASLAAALLLIALLVAACSDQNSADGDGVRPLRPPDVNASDVMFVQMMIPHHEQAVEMAALAPTRADDPIVKELAQRIGSAQAPEIDQMRGWLNEWGVVEMTNHAGHMKAGSMKGIMTGQQMANLKRAEGAAFDRLFLSMMIEHHEGAIDMAQDGLANGENEPVLRLERAIVTSQEGEVAEMKGLLGS